MSESTPSRSPMSCHLALTEVSNISNVCFSGLVARMGIRMINITYFIYTIILLDIHTNSKSTPVVETIAYKLTIKRSIYNI